MSDLNDKLNLIQNARDEIKNSLLNQNLLVNNDLRTYSNAINNLSNTYGTNATVSDILLGKTAYSNGNLLVGTYQPNSSSGDVKLFDSVINMQNSSGNQEGDLAVVYSSSQANITEDTEFQIAIFPETVTLTTAVTDYIEIGFKPVESAGVMFDCWGSLSPDRFNIDVYTDEGNIRVQYTSQDGLAYTRTEFTQNGTTIEGNELDFGVVIKFGSDWMSLTWDDRIGQFIITGSSDFEGFFNYVTNIPNYATPYQHIINDINSNNVVNYNFTNNFINSYTITDILYSNNSRNVFNSLGLNVDDIQWNWSYLNLLQNGNNLDFYLYTGDSETLIYVYSFGYCYNKPVLLVDNIPNIGGVYSFSLDLMNNSLSGSIFNNVEYFHFESNWKYINYNYLNTGIYSINYNNSNFVKCSNFNIVNLTNDDYLNTYAELSIEYNTYNEWNYVTTQLSKANPELIYKGTYYGSNGVTNGTLYKTVDLTTANELKQRAMIYNSFSELSTDSNIAIDLSYAFSHLRYLPSIINIPNIGNMYATFEYFEGNTIDVSNFDTGNCSNFVQCFYGCSNISSIIGLDTLNTSNSTFFEGMFCSSGITDITLNLNSIDGPLSTSHMFGYCSNLTSVNLGIETLKANYIEAMFIECYALNNLDNLITIDCLNINNFRDVFRNCFNLVEIPNLINTSNIIDISGSFAGCHNITTIPNFNTSNVETMIETFGDCHNITTIPNFDLSNIYYANYLFRNCYNLVSVPILNLNKLRFTANMFSNCNNLSDTSYANIVNSLPNASQLFNRFVSHTGLNTERLTSTQKTILRNKGYIDMGDNQYTITYS